MKPFFSPFSVFFAILTVQADFIPKWNHFSRRFWSFIFHHTFLWSVFGTFIIQKTVFWNHFLRRFFRFSYFRKKLLHFETIFLAVFTIITFSELSSSPEKVVTMHFFQKILPFFSPFLKFCYQVYFLRWFHQKLKPFFSPFFIVLF